MAQEEKVKIVLVERSPLIVSALRDLISRDHRFEFVESLPAGEMFVERLMTERISFDIALVGWQLIDMDAGEVLLELQRRQLAARIVVLCNENDAHILKRCVRLGAQGFCYQFDDPGILFDTLLAVANDRICIPRIDLARINETPLSKLTVREFELLAVLSDGWTNLQIATRTGISENTVKYHLKNLYDKLSVRNRAMAVALFAAERKNAAVPHRW
ncbi:MULTISPECIES: LuxR C-terminal-related transcriptional regulator [unclassified Mesorhizobium]|uniref:LuxR C-terminal-related transcriptional regulator n=1 Tax=unclassified Mesorhizobium TaxID=325217 RepID=UPI00046461E3|nr:MULTISPECIES: response regulator transcription factor [unclassified Mesorhizobium]